MQETRPDPQMEKRTSALEVRVCYDTWGSIDLVSVLCNGDWGQYKCWPRSYALLATQVVTSARQVIAVILTFQWPSLQVLESVHVVGPIQFPYVPGLLSFREIPSLRPGVGRGSGVVRSVRRRPGGGSCRQRVRARLVHGQPLHYPWRGRIGIDPGLHVVEHFVLVLAAGLQIGWRRRIVRRRRRGRRWRWLVGISADPSTRKPPAATPALRAVQREISTHPLPELP